MTPLYRALCAASLFHDGVLEPSVSATGHFRDESGYDVLEGDSGVALIIQALAFADTATGATIGREVVKTLAKHFGIEGLEARYEVHCRSSHRNSNIRVVDALHDVTLFLAAQPAR